MSIFPFINYELMTMRAGIRNGKNRWKISLGTDVTFTNHKRTDNHFGKYFTISRHYYLDDQGELIGSINYAQRKFALTNQKISYSTSVTSEMQYYNINFDVSYIDVLLLPSVHNRDSNLKITVGIGPLISIQILERTEYNLIKVDTLTNKLNDQDFRFITDEPPFPFPYLGFCGAVDLEYRSVLIQLKFESSISKSNQIEFLNDETRLSTIKIAVGYCFN